MMEKQARQEVVKKFQLHEKDTGSCEVQVSLLTQRINYLTAYLKDNKKDVHSRYGLLKLVGRRRKFINYLKRKKPEELMALAKKLKLKVK